MTHLQVQTFECLQRALGVYTLISDGGLGLNLSTYVVHVI